MVSYVPERGDIAWVDMDPQVGSEVAKRRPCLILSPKEYNAKTLLCIAIPITSQDKQYPFHVKLPDYCTIDGLSGFLMTDQIKSVSWHVRKAEKITKMSHEDINRALFRVKALIGIA